MKNETENDGASSASPSPEVWYAAQRITKKMAGNSLLGLLHSNGYQTVEGADAVRAAIAEASDGSTELLCSGFRVFPDGKQCPGCRDCKGDQ